MTGYMKMGAVGRLENELGFIVGQIEEVTQELQELQEQKAEVLTKMKSIKESLGW